MHQLIHYNMGSKSAIGIGNGICFKQVRDKGGGSYIDPLVRDSIVGLWKFDQNTNESPTRNIIKNTIKDKGGDLELLNFGYKLNSGYGGYIEDFSLFILSNRFEYSEISDTKVTITAVLDNGTGIYHAVTKENSALYWNTFKIKVSGSTDDVYISYVTAEKNIRLYNGINTVVVPNELSWHSFSASKVNTSCNITLEFVPLYEGALVTDGKDDMIVSQKSFIDIVGSNNQPYTIVSMISFIDNLHTYFNSAVGISYMTINNIADSAKGKTGIFGYSATNINNTQTSIINNILGDKNDYTTRSETAGNLIGREFSIQGYLGDGIPTNVSSVAVYWTFIANKVLTTDEINQIIAYYKLDKYVTPQVIYDVKRQGLTNDTPDSDWYLKDFSGNGHDMQLYNYIKTPESGINEEGGLQSDGVTDYGQFVGDLGLKDYTVAVDRAYPSFKLNAVPVVSDTSSNGATTFLFEFQAGDRVVRPFSFGGTTILTTSLELNRKISYQSTYVYNNTAINKGKANGISRGLTIGRFGINIQYANITLWSLLLFPYTLSEFLLERQLKRYKLGTLYPNMVEFRPIIKSNIDTLKINYWDKDWNVVNVGDYVSVGNDIKTNITVPNGYKVSKVTSDAFDNITIEKSSTDFIYDVKFYGIKKSPQKITMTIEQDENYVKFEPVITSNAEYVRLDFHLNNYQKRVNIGDYIPKDAYLRANFYLKNNVDELTVFTFNGVNIDYKRSSVDDTAFNINQIYNYDSPQEVNITIDEYIRYEDIVQPYPILLRFNDENGNEVSWGGKFKVGSTITRIGSVADPESNLLSGLYSISGLSLNDKAVTSSTSIVEKQMVFRTTATWLLDNNEPKVILSPSRLRIPNSSYKLLGYIPDISGHGNHGKINNSAYAGMSGVNGYPVVFGANKTWANESNEYVTSITSNTIHITNVLNAGLALLYSYVKYNGNLQNIKEIPSFKIEIKGLEGKSKFIYKYLATSDATEETNLYLGNGTHELPKSFLPTEALINNAVVGFSISPIEEGVTDFLSDITIKVLPEYEGAYCLDGVDDFITIPTTVGGKQVLMKVNWQSIAGTAILYDQRTNGGFAIFNRDFDIYENKVPAYRAGNIGGGTYIDGILNRYIYASELKNITHNIVELHDPKLNTGTLNPKIGSSYLNSNYAQMSLYDFMLFDEFSTEDKIKELNKYVGIEAKVELPPYY